MADTFTSLLRLRQPEVGANNNIWGGYLNTDFALLDSAITGVVAISITGLTTLTLTANQGTTDQSRYPVYNFTGALAANCTITLPQTTKFGWVINATTGGFNVILTTGIGTTLTVAPGTSWQFYYCDGTNITSPSLASGVGGTGLVVAGNLTVGGTSTLTGNVSMAGTLGVTGLLAAAGAVTVGTTLGVTGASTLAALAVSGAATLTAAGTALAVTNNSTFGGTVAITGATTAAAITASGAVTVNARAILKTEDMATSDLGSFSGATNLDLSVANYFFGTVTGNVTFSLTNVPASGRLVGFAVELTNAGAHTITLPSGAVTPSAAGLTWTTSGKDIAVASTRNGGTASVWSIAQSNVA